MIIRPKRTIYPKTDIDGNPIRGDTFYRIIKWHEEMREGTKFVIYDKLQKFDGAGSTNGQETKNSTGD